MNQKRILYLSYNGILSHLGLSQILPYIKELSKNGYDFFVVSFEEKEKKDTELGLIYFHWYPLRKGKGWRWFLLAKNLFLGIVVSAYLVVRYKIRIVHARSYIPAFIGMLLKNLFPRLRLLFDIRGFMLDEYLEGGLVKPTSPAVKLCRFVEKRIFGAADAIVTLTHRSARVLKEQEWFGKREIPVTIIPCCVDISEHQSAYHRTDRNNSPGIERVHLIYIGSLGSWYDLPRMLAFFKVFNNKFPSSKLTIVSPQAPFFKEIVQTSELAHRITLTTAVFSEIPHYLKQSHIGLLFYRSGFSRIATSPIKFPEYLRFGLPVVATPGIGDLDELIVRYGVGVILDSSDEEAVDRLSSLLGDSELKNRCQQMAREHYDLRQGSQKYETVYETLSR